MSDPLGTYSFLPWLRLGIANQIGAADEDHAVKVRATVEVELTLKGKALGGGADLLAHPSRPVSLYGPGDIVGLESRAIVKVEPRDGFTNYEPNYLPHIEFYDEDLPWRYTPAAPDLAKHRLRPWLALAVLAESEFESGKGLRTGPLETISLLSPPGDVFPPADQLWAWAHVHVNQDLVKNGDAIRSTDLAAVLPRLASLLDADPDRAYSRIVSPRQLEPNRRYHAFLLPTFESGRLAGLGLTADAANPDFYATLSAWADYGGRPQGNVYPFYYRWSFKTGETGDFESLARLLKPRPPDARLGRRDIDVLEPGSNIDGIDVPGLDGVLRLEGALRVPDQALDPAQEAERKKFDQWDLDYPHLFQRQLAAFVNLGADYAEKVPEDANAGNADLPAAIQSDPDPLIVPPIYGRWHALTDRLLFNEDGTEAPQNRNWVHQLNLDPRFRVAAGFGTAVVQDKQEELMDAAWEQVGEIIAANRLIRQGQVAREVSFVWYDRHLGPVKGANEERGFVLMAPVHRRVLSGGLTVHHQVAKSRVPRAALSAPMRRILRPRGHVAKRLGFARPAGPADLLDQLNTGKVLPAPPKTTPDALPTVEKTAAQLPPGTLLVQDLPGMQGMRERPWLAWLLPLLLLLLALLVFLLLPVAGAVLGTLLALAAVFLFFLISWLLRRPGKAGGIQPGSGSPGEIEGLPGFPDFQIGEPVVGQPAGPAPRPGQGDSSEGTLFKDALEDVQVLIATSTEVSRVPERPRIDIPGLSTTTYETIDPLVTIPDFVLGGITIPGRLIVLIGESFKEALAYPEFDMPMYKPLTEPTVERFLPGIQHLPQNTVTLLETNQRFIEAYMVGLNHEFARELLWREYPTDQRGSYFRQFWDVSGVRNTENLSKEALREKLRDIPPLHLWSKFSKLGDHDHRENPGENEAEVVLVIRGELLKRYPTAVVYAHRAKWQLDQNGVVDPTQERMLETSGNPENNILLPLYEAEAKPDVFFRGFDLTAQEAKGGSGMGGDLDPGWFFVITERPGEPRFGLDIAPAAGGTLNTWNDLAWPQVLGGDDKGFLRLGAGTPTLSLVAPNPDTEDEKVLQHLEDKKLQWHQNTNSAELAYILYQAPVLVAMHGKVMLPD